MRAVCWSFFLIMHVFCAFGVNASEVRPNIIFILTDDQRNDTLSLYDTFPWLETPNIDRLAMEGVLFENAFVTTAVCSPSRASFLTGTYAFRHGVVVNAYKDPDASLPTFPALLQSHGYETAFIGKWHMAENAEPRKGFDHWVSFPKQGAYYENVFNVNGESVKSTRYITDDLTDRAIDFLNQKRDRPFMLYLSHKAIHAPFEPARRHEDLYSGVNFESFDNPEEDMSTKPKWLQKHSKRLRSKPDSTAAMRLNMLRALSAVDESVGRILQELAGLGVLDNTVIVYAGDNGYFYGEHGNLIDKRKAYEQSIRVPIIMRYPPAVESGSRFSELVLNIDLAPTLLQLAGLEAPDTMQGRSWTDLLEGEAKDWRQSFLYEYYWQDKYRPRSPKTATPTILAVRTNDWKYITYPELEGEISELYNLRKDPQELRNLAVEPGFQKDLERMKGELEAVLDSTGYVKPIPAEKSIFCTWLDIYC